MDKKKLTVIKLAIKPSVERYVCMTVDETCLYFSLLKKENVSFIKTDN